jgi:hypothetical protein
MSNPDASRATNQRRRPMIFPRGERRGFDIVRDMPEHGPLRGKANKPPAPTKHRCVLCHQDLHFVRQHVSPARFGPVVTTDFYQCGACDAGFAQNLATGKWQRWVGDDN